MVSSEEVSMTVGIPPRKQSLRSARRFMLGRLACEYVTRASASFWIILADLVRLLRLRLVYIAKSGRRTQNFQFLDGSGLPGYTALR